MNLFLSAPNWKEKMAKKLAGWARNHPAKMKLLVRVSPWKIDDSDVSHVK